MRSPRRVALFVLVVLSLSGLALVLLPVGAISVVEKDRSIWDPNQAPLVSDIGPDRAKELGIRFKSEVNGTVRGIRFFKASAHSSQHAVRLWTVAGNLLASATSGRETSFGWQQVDFPTPVAIRAGAVYVASYHSDTGYYSYSPHYFMQSGVDNPPLHALASGTAGGNGVYAEGLSSVFPEHSQDSANYWVDVAFTPSEASLVSISVEPASASIVAGKINRFTASARYSDGSTGELDNGLVVWESEDPGVATVNRFGVAMGVAGGQTTITAHMKSVTASAALAVAAGPSRTPEPLLVVTSAANPFSSYLPEILRAEGLNEFDVLDISRVSRAALSEHDLLLLGDTPLTAFQAAMITEWVEDGGKLIAMHPDKRLAGLLGLADAGGTLADAYLRMETGSGPGVALVAVPIQYHGSADRYWLRGATSVATLYSSSSAATLSPAVTLNAIGRGQAAAFTYDLARSVIYTRQGNPAWSGQARDQEIPIRAYELFFGASRQDPQPDWVDFNNIAIPQADEQQRLLANLILGMMTKSKPLPRFWYLPRGLAAAVVMTGDDHGYFQLGQGGAVAARFRDYLNASPPGCNLEDWECVRATAYVFPPAVASNALRNEQAAEAISQGFEIAVHFNEYCSDWKPAALDDIYTRQLHSFALRYVGVPPAQTGRTHCVSWSDYDSQPEVELEHGIRLDTNYYYYPPTWIKNRPGLFTGSGMPMRFASRRGTVIDVYQAATQMTDESGQSYPFTIDVLLDNATGPLGYYGVFTANMHSDISDTLAARSIVTSAQSHGVPVVSALQMLKWLDGRNGSFFSALEWKRDVLTFTVSVAAGANGLEVLLPAQGPSGPLVRIARNQSAVPYTTRVIKGIEYAIFAAGTGGAFQAAYAAPHPQRRLRVAARATNPSEGVASAQPQEAPPVRHPERAATQGR
jgi:hypothetical protein